MPPAFSLRVTSREWLTEASEWIVDQAAAQGIEVRGLPEQRRVRPWSTQLVVDSDAGPLWLKANTTALRFEAAVHQCLAGLAPQWVQAPVAIDADRGWMLSREAGPPLGTVRTPTRADWANTLTSAAHLRRRTAGERDRLLALGLPDCGPSTVVGRLDRLLEELRALPAGHPSHLSPELAADVEAARPRVVEAAAVLADSPALHSLQHADLHPWNVFEVDGGVRLFDFGDAQWAHAFEVLQVPRGWVTQKFAAGWSALVEQYLDVWEVGAAEVADLLAAAALCHPVNRALTWWSCLAEATTAELHVWGAAPAEHLHGVAQGA